jgi:hypothetical protein
MHRDLKMNAVFQLFLPELNGTENFNYNFTLTL